MTIDGHMMEMVKQYPTGAYLLYCPTCGLTLIKDFATGQTIPIDFGPQGEVRVIHRIMLFPPKKAARDEMAVWREALKDIEL